MEAARPVLPFAKRFKDLDVYRRAFELSLDVHSSSLDFPKHEQYGGIADQMRRASKSVCATIAEGHGKNAYVGEWRRFLMMALGSCEEMQVWTDYARRLEYIPSDAYELWSAEYSEFARMIQGLLNKAKEKTV